MADIQNREQRVEALRALAEYEFLSESEIPEIRAVAVTMAHRKTGARVFLLLSDDPNKVFTIGFRTPAQDSTGVAHIVEHTVLCGSEKYPAKDPFVELVKGSMNTFLNAMTYPDKTIYPVASCNDTDFRNLMDVYLDAVFHPRLYREKKIFQQEGWHYEAESADGPLSYNGVVYNEMKGVYSSADGVLERAVNEALFPGHPYAEESGGDPDFIPDLSYEAYLDFHSRYYHPSNSFIYLYGSADMTERLSYLDREYLSKYEARPIHSEIPVPKPLAAPVTREYEYSVSESESEENAAYLSLNMRVGCELDPLRYNAFQALDYVLLEVPGAPLHDALIDAGIGEDVGGGYNYGICEPYFSVTARNARCSQKDDFLAVIRTTLERLRDGGLDHGMVKAALNVAEFRAREADFGSYPKGLMYGIECFNSWLYGADPCMHLRFDALFEELKQKVDENFFEALIGEYLLDNRNEALVILRPVSGLTARREARIREKLDAAAAGMSREEREQIVRETKALKAYQSEASTAEELLKIPLLARSDIGRAAERLHVQKEDVAGLPVIRSEVFTSGIVYLRLMFDCGSLSLEDLSYLSLMRDVLGYMDTGEHSYAQLSTLINRNSGGIGFGLESYPDLSAEGGDTFLFYASAKVLEDRVDFALHTMREMLLTTRFSDVSRLKDNLNEVKAGLKDRLTSAGHVAALNRAGSFLSAGAAFGDATKGIRYFKLLERLAADFDLTAERIAARLRDIAERIFTADNLTLHVTCDRSGYGKVRAALRGLRGSFPETALRPMAFDWREENRREGWESASQVNYVARFGNFRKHGFAYTGALRVLKLLLSYDYLWNNIRVRGGAYGCSASFGRTGSAGFTSYRDPKLMETDRVYDGIADFAEHFSADEREMTKSIIGTIAELDAPLTPLQRGLRGLSAYYSHVTDEALQKERDEILDAQPEDIRALAPLLRAVLSDGARCVIGNESQLRAAKENFTDVKPLFQGI